MTRVLYLAEPIDQAENIGRNMVVELVATLRTMDWAIYRPRFAWQIGSRAEPGLEVDLINREALTQADAVVAYLPSGVPTIGVPREIELARGYGVPVCVMRPNSNRISWALQDVPVFTSTMDAARWLAELPGKTAQGMMFHVGPNGRMPQRTYQGDAGYDLFASEDVTIMIGEFRDVRTDVSVALPPNIWARITGRSSTWRKRGLLTMEGVIDTGYRGELLAGLYNAGQGAVSISAGERVAQLIPHLNLNGSLPVSQVDRDTFERISAVDGRGSNGFGSSGN